MPTEPSVFISYNREDWPAVEALEELLRRHKIAVWLDNHELQPGAPWLPTLQKALERSEAIVVAVGSSGLGRWQEPEVEAALAEQVRHQERRVIPVFLPGAPDAEKANVPTFLRRNTWVIFRGGFDDQMALDQLLWGITGENPFRQRERQPGADLPHDDLDPVEEAVFKLSDSMKSGCLTYILGSGAADNGSRIPTNNSNEIARRLLTELRLIAPEQEGLLLPPMDVASLYYSVQSGDTQLENKVVELMIGGSKYIPTLYRKLCQLILSSRREPVRRMRGGPKLPQLIVTTNLDVMLERAFLTAGIPFTRIVQHGSAPSIFMNEYRDVAVLKDGVSLSLSSNSGSPRIVNLHDFDDLDDAIATHGSSVVELRPTDGSAEQILAPNPLHSLPLQNLPAPILYKFRGSQDIRDSCVISADQYLSFARRLLKQNLIPAKISDILANTDVLLIGYGSLDPEFRLTYQLLLRRVLEIKNYERYSLQKPPQSETEDVSQRFEMRLWSRIKRERLRQTGIVTVEEQGERFLDRMSERIQTDS